MTAPSGTTLRGLGDLVDAGLVRARDAAAIAPVVTRYAVAITPTIASLIDQGDPADPIARQFVPTPAELDARPEERLDPIGDKAHSPLPGIVHRYPDRVLLKVLHVCPVYCRFCFRREVVGPGEAAMLPPDAVEGALDYIAGHRSIWEVILTGGDPFMLSPRRMTRIMERLAAIDHVRIIRLHTRVPVADPDRVTGDLIAALKVSRKTVFVALHANHPRELGASARAACARLIDAGIAMISQTVLLRGVNDDAEILGALMRGFVEARVKPYYLHHGDLAPGTSHFRVSLEEGQALVAALRGRLSGLCQPTYVVDLPGGHGKVPAARSGITMLAGGSAEIEDYRGGKHIYPPP